MIPTSRCYVWTLSLSRCRSLIGIAGLSAAYGVLKAQREGANVKLDVYEGAVRHSFRTTSFL
jgi:hypothetical protein